MVNVNMKIYFHNVVTLKKRILLSHYLWTLNKLPWFLSVSQTIISWIIFFQIQLIFNYFPTYGYEDGSYHPDSRGQYITDERGKYVPDSRGFYVHQPGPDGPPAPPYVHVTGPNGGFGGNGGLGGNGGNGGFGPNGRLTIICCFFLLNIVFI